MSYNFEKSTGDIVINEWEKGISSSPHSGIANMQNVNIATETGEVMCSFNRVQQNQVAINGTFTNSGSSSTFVLGTHTGSLLVGCWITILTSTISELVVGTKYYVLDNASLNNYKLSATFSQSSTDAISSTSGGTATFSLSYFFASPLASATEFYNASDGTPQNRYYILDSTGRVWVNDSYAGNFSGVTQPLWFLPNAETTGGATGIAVLNGWLFVFSFRIYCKSTVKLYATLTQFSGGTTMTYGSSSTHFAYVGHQGKLYYTDNNFIGSIFPNSSLLSGVVNIQSYINYTSTSTAGTIVTTISGTIPTTATAGIPGRIPAYFFATGSGASVATALFEGTVYYVDYTDGISTPGKFKVYAALTGGSALDITTGAVGTQYFNTFYPISGDGLLTITYSPQRLNLPTFERAQCLGEVGNSILIGCSSNVIYPWNQIDPTPGDIITIPENNTTSIINVNNMGYVFAGNKGNIYITNGSSASAVITVPDYCAGISGTPSTYIEPYFVWGGTMFLRGRVYFSIKDQTGVKAGNCGGIWSFVPTQNLYIGQNTGLSLRLENVASYATYNGYSPVLIPSQNQIAIAPQYWNSWNNGGQTGIDFTGTTTGNVAVIETDLIPTGTFLDKKSFKQIEYKLSSPLAVGESVSISYRQNSTDAYVSCGTAVVESTTGLSGYFPASFEKGQWLQLKITLTPLSTSSSSFVRLTELRIR